ncbi:dephospho-CoA kinase [Mycolicibacterium mageritense]|uniref:dephospho-CoA kinase n=1 Tax=Mycolicibacterium mageritense TaxID=53462 RepID=UPI0011D99AA0|nr:dephospho-CoA kinase [Mycolicibacterium mageritense]TXI57159.1 MAG: dephospho-CoA kinase [Mycolicibacterium mageritense]
MLRIGLTGGIGAGKSTVSAAFSELGGIVVDGDVIAREVVEPGTEGLAKLVEAFGDGILLPDGALNRPALAAVAFSDDEKRATLNGIVHPLVARRRAELIDAAPADAVIVEDIPLLVESHMAPLFPLVVIVHADEDVRVARLISYRGFSEADARARIAAQATVEQRRVVADVWLDNSGDAEALRDSARQLWYDRILPFAQNMEIGAAAAAPPQPVPYDPSWPEQAGRIIARLQAACGHRAVRIDHVGPTAVPGTEAADVIDVQVTVESLDVADELADALTAVGYVRLADGIDGVEPDARSTVAEFDHSDDPNLWRSRLHGSADPGRPTNVHLRVEGWPDQQYALLCVDWRRAHPGTLEAGAYRRVWEWADATGWRP